MRSRTLSAERVQFLKRMYLHLVVALVSFFALIGGLVYSPVGDWFYQLIRPISREEMLLTLMLFMGTGYISRRMARTRTSLPMQYAGLTLSVVAHALFLFPIIYFATVYYPDLVPQAFIMATAIFIGLSAIVIITRKDFSFLRGALILLGTTLLAFLFAGIAFGFSIGIWWVLLAIILVAASILYHTSNALLRYQTDQYVAASLSLFTSFVFLFTRILRVLIYLKRR